MPVRLHLNNGILKKAFLTALVFIGCLVFAALMPPREAQAFGGCTCSCFFDCDCVNDAHEDLRDTVQDEHNDTRSFFGTSGFICDFCGTGELGDHERWLIVQIYYLRFLPAMMKMTEQLSAVMMQQMLILGTFIDAEHQLDIQLMVQDKATETLRDYREDVQLCHIGTGMRSLAATQQRGNITKAALTARSVNRQLGNNNSASAVSPSSDKQGRLEQFRDVFCDKYDNNHVAAKPSSGLAMICGGPVNPAERLNSDIDYTGTMELPLTLDLAFADTPNALDGDEETVLSMSNYLYAHDLFTRPTSGHLSILQNQSGYLDLRSVVAKRSVAENSFNAIAALKTKGAGGAANTMSYMRYLLEELGMTPPEIEAVYGEEPSYMAQMEILAKNMYQRPEFYAGLQGTPANTARKKAAMDAIGIMLDRDIYESRLRSEMILSILLELDIIGYQEEMENFVNAAIVD